MPEKQVNIFVWPSSEWTTFSTRPSMGQFILSRHRKSPHGDSSSIKAIYKRDPLTGSSSQYPTHAFRKNTMFSGPSTQPGKFEVLLKLPHKSPHSWLSVICMYNLCIAYS